MGRSSLIALLLTGTLAACAGGGGDEFVTRSNPIESRSAEEIFLRAEDRLERRDPEEAAELFGEIERLYPYSEWAQRAIVMQALAYHRDKDYAAARGAAERYLAIYPAGEDAAYAQYLLALSYYDQIDDVGRDQDQTFEALSALRDVIELYPDSEYARSASLQFDLAYDHLAAAEMDVGRYYLRRGNYTAAINRFRTVVEDFQTSSQTPEALLRLVEAYLSLGIESEARTAGAILGYNFQSTPEYDRAYALLTGRGLTLEASGDSWLSSVYRQVVRGEWL